MTCIPSLFMYFWWAKWEAGQIGLHQANAAPTLNKMRFPHHGQVGCQPTFYLRPQFEIMQWARETRVYSRIATMPTKPTVFRNRQVEKYFHRLLFPHQAHLAEPLHKPLFCPNPAIPVLLCFCRRSCAASRHCAEQFRRVLANIP